MHKQGLLAPRRVCSVPASSFSPVTRDGCPQHKAIDGRTMLNYPGPGWPPGSAAVPPARSTRGEAAPTAPVPAPDHCPRKYSGVLIVLIVRSLTLHLCTHCASRQIQVEFVFLVFQRTGGRCCQVQQKSTSTFGVAGCI